MNARSRVTNSQFQSTLLTLGVMLGPLNRCRACVIFCVIQCVTFRRNSKFVVSKMKSVVGGMTEECLSRHRQEQEAGLVPAEQGQRLLKVGYLGWLVEQTATWKRGLCGRSVMQGGLGHVCAPTQAQRVCGSGDTNQQCSTERVIRSRSGPAQRGIWRGLNENGRG